MNEKPGQLEWAKKAHGAYILRTNTDCEDSADLISDCVVYDIGDSFSCIFA